MIKKIFLSAIILIAFSLPALASGKGGVNLNLTDTSYALIALIVFIGAYVLVIAEERIHMRKSKPVIVAGTIIWALVALAFNKAGHPGEFKGILEHNILEFAFLFLFLLAAMTFINTMEERNVFNALRAWLVSKGFSLYWIFWITGVLAFFISPIADNLTTALLMAAVVMAVASDKPKFVAMACVNIVVAANAGGAFSPFGDITTLMVWQKGIVQFDQFFVLFLPAVVNWIIPAVIMSFFVEKGRPEPMADIVNIKKGGFVVVALFIATIATAVTFHNVLHLPPALGMMGGLGVLKLFGYYLKMTDNDPSNDTQQAVVGKFDIFTQIQRAEWDTLMFFYGVIMCVGGLGALGYLGVVAQFMYVDLGTTNANILVGILSAIVDNIPVMFAVLTMNPEMGLDQWLLVTLTAGVGGSLLSVGSAAGVALMGKARGIYTFFAHLKWSWAIGLGYAASIWVHMWLQNML